jgi:lipopolysaccharide export system protein LptA
MRPVKYDHDSLVAGVVANIAAEDAPPPALHAGRQIVFIDAAVTDEAVLARAAAPGVTVVRLTASADGLAQIAAYLTAHHVHGLAAIDIVGHGADGALSLGSTLLDSADISAHAAALAAIGAALDAGGGIRLYGCDIAQDATGVAFIDAISKAAGGVPVAAAAGLVGSAALGGTWSLDVNTGGIAAPAPFTAQGLSAYPDLLPTSTVKLFYSADGSAQAGNNRIEEITATGATGASPTVLVNGYTITDFGVMGLAVDAPENTYFISYYNTTGSNNESLISRQTIGGAQTVYNTTSFGFTTGTDFVDGIALDQPNHTLYLAVTSNTQANNGIWKIGENLSGKATAVATDANGANPTLGNVTGLSVDSQDGVIFFIDQGVDLSIAATNNIDVANIATGTIKVLITGSTSASAPQINNLAVDIADRTLYYTESDDNNDTSADAIVRATFTVNGSNVTLGNVTTLYATSKAGEPLGIALDVPDGLFYVVDDTGKTVDEGSLTGASALASVTNSVVQTGGVTTQGNLAELVIDVPPTIAASGTVTYTQGGPPVVADAGLTTGNPNNQNLAGATVAISAGAFSGDGDVLTATTAGTGITASYNTATETLTLTGEDTVAHYQQVLDGITFSSAASNPTKNGASPTRTLTWSVTDGINTSTAPSSTVAIHVAPTVTAGATVTYTAGAAPVAADPALTVASFSGGMLNAATVSIGSGFLAGDTLALTASGGITGSYNTASGVLTLSGSATAAAYQTVLDSVTFTDTNADPTKGGTDLARTLTWTVSDPTLTSSPSTSTVDVFSPPTVTAGASVVYTAPGAGIAVDPALTVADAEAATLSGATVTIKSGLLSGDTLGFFTQNGIVASFNAGTGTLTLTGTSSVANYQAALDSVTFSSTATDPTKGGSDLSRTISYTVTDSLGEASTPAASTVTIHTTPVVTAGASVGYKAGGPPVALDSKLTVSDPGATMLAGATVSISSGFLAGDTLGFANGGGITGSYNASTGTLTLTGNASVAAYQAGLDALTYSSTSPDPTQGGADPQRTISYTVTDQFGTASNIATSTVAPCFLAGTRLLTARGPVAVEDLRAGERMVTHDGALLPAAWIGQRALDARTHPRPDEIAPIRIAAGAVAPGIPAHDVLLSPDHAVFLDGVLVAARQLVNGTTIAQDHAIRAIRYFHVQLPRHAVLLAEGLAAESYLDTGNRGLFENGGAPLILHPDLGAASRGVGACAPFVTAEDAVRPLWRRLAARAAELGRAPETVAHTGAPVPMLRADGRLLRPVAQMAGRIVFAVPPRAEKLRLVSRAASPAATRPWSDDRRSLGIAVARIVATRGATCADVPLDHPALDSGWWDIETGAGRAWRWTDGAASLPPADLIDIHLHAAGAYPVQTQACTPPSRRTA